ncbi:MAG: glycosyltransferase, partial [Thermoplasmata archaeon]|nr:glycosyltransferase [Thermoplasmata archaeon]
SRPTFAKMLDMLFAPLGRILCVPGRTIDLVAVGPCPRDPYDPAASAWALAAGFASLGDEVRVLHPAGLEGAALPDGVMATQIDVPLRRPGAVVEGASLSLAAGRRIRPSADLVVRDPFGLGKLGLDGRRGSRPAVVGVVHRLELATYDAESSLRNRSSLFDRVDTWRDRRTVRRLERVALDEAHHLVYDSPELPEVLAREYGISAGRLRPVPPSVRDSGSRFARDEARQRMHLPLDVPVVVAPLASEDPRISGSDRVRDAFRRTRSLFAGARLVVVGGPAPSEPGVSSLPDRDSATFERAFAAGDVTLVAPTAIGFDPGVVLSLRAKCPVIVGPGVRFPLDPGGAVRTVASDDPAELAAALAELLADSRERRELAAAGEQYADWFHPERVATMVSDGLGRAAS